MSEVKLLTEDEAAKFLGISKTTLYRLRRDRLISCYPIRSRKLVRFTEAHLADFLSRVERKANSSTIEPAAESPEVKAA